MNSFIKWLYFLCENLKVTRIMYFPVYGLETDKYPLDWNQFSAILNNHVSHWYKFYNFYFNIRGKLSVIWCNAWFVWSVWLRINLYPAYINQIENNTGNFLKNWYCMRELSAETVYFPQLTNLTLDFQFLKQIKFYPRGFPSSDPFNQGLATVLKNLLLPGCSIISSTPHYL